MLTIKNNLFKKEDELIDVYISRMQAILNEYFQINNLTDKMIISNKKILIKNVNSNNIKIIDYLILIKVLYELMGNSYSSIIYYDNEIFTKENLYFDFRSIVPYDVKECLEQNNYFDNSCLDIFIISDYLYAQMMLLLL